jgi:hypothetical protein
MRNKYTPKQIKFLSTGYPVMGIPELTRAFNRKFRKNKTEGAIKNALTNRKITSGRSTGALNKGRIRLLILNVPSQIKFLKTNYPLYSQKELIAKFNKRFITTLTEQQIVSFMRNHHIRSGRTGRFNKGHVPWDKGTKGLLHGSCTSFKKGQIPANTRPLGSERIDNKDGYIHIKITEPNPYTKAQTRFKQKHVVLWEREHGPVPKGFAVIFKDGDRMNCIPENLELVSRAELLVLNQNKYRDMPPEIKPALLTMAKLKAKTSSLLKEV